MPVYRQYFTQTLTQLPTSPTTLNSNTGELLEMYISNNGVGTATITVQDGNNGYLIPALGLAPAGMMSVTSGQGIPMVKGITWSASATGVWGSVKMGLL